MSSASAAPPPGPPLSARQPAALFDLLGGESTFHQLVANFYEGVRNDPVLRPLYPDEDLRAAEERLRMFLIQYWGGPHTYSQQRGHPRLRMRHVPFKIGTRERDAWLARMRAALDQLALPAEADNALWTYFTGAAESLRNVPD